MRNEERHCGWHNYETFIVGSGIDNDSERLESWGALAEECYRDAEPDGPLSRLDVAVNFLECHLKDGYEDEPPELPEPYGTLLCASLGRVNWREIARHLLEYAKDKVDEEDAEFYAEKNEDAPEPLDADSLGF